ncbi:MAG: PfkB family carbohydrate kinase [Clostridia bacterium]|nr:PfkB family carbohydrate kinase [Clostridia bacterium]
MNGKLIAVGDNVVDCYLDDGVYYPGGNAVNVAVNCKRDGLTDVAYIGMFGDDEKAAHIKWALNMEGITYDRSRTMYAPSGSPGVKLVDGDRQFVPGLRNTAQHVARIRLMPEDLDYIGQYDVCHTSCFSSIEYELPAMAKVCQVSFDFSENTDEAYLQRVCPHLTYAFFSGADKTPEELDKLIDTCHALGVKVVGITMGSRGALFSEDGKRYTQGIVKVEAIDTMGAGDSFIAGFLTRRVLGDAMEDALRYAAQVAANTCMIHGSFGYPHQL